jgi:hypothetical protein
MGNPGRSPLCLPAGHTFPEDIEKIDKPRFLIVIQSGTVFVKFPVNPENQSQDIGGILKSFPGAYRRIGNGRLCFSFGIIVIINGQGFPPAPLIPGPF